MNDDIVTVPQAQQDLWEQMRHIENHLMTTLKYVQDVSTTIGRPDLEEQLSQMPVDLSEMVLMIQQMVVRIPSEAQLDKLIGTMMEYERAIKAEETV